MIPNTFSGFGSMTVRNTNMVTMSCFVVMIQCMFHEKRDSECADYTELSNCQEATLLRSAPECRTPTDAQFTSCYARQRKRRHYVDGLIVTSFATQRLAEEAGS